MTIKSDLMNLGVAAALAVEFQNQITTGVGNVRRLMELGFTAAAQFVAGLNAGTLRASKLAEVGVPTVVAQYLVKAINMPPVNTVAPVLSGTPTVGEQLSVTTGTWTSKAGTPTYTYKWFRGATELSATGSTYTLVAADEGFNIIVQVEATNANGSAVAASNQLGPVEPE